MALSGLYTVRPLFWHKKRYTWKTLWGWFVYASRIQMNYSPLSLNEQLSKMDTWYWSMPIDHTAMNVAMNVWLYNEKIIPLFCYSVPVLAVLYKLNRSVFIVNSFRCHNNPYYLSWTLLQNRQSGPVPKVSLLEIVDCMAYKCKKYSCSLTDENDINHTFLKFKLFTHHLKYFLWQRLFAIPHHAVHKFAECESKMNNEFYVKCCPIYRISQDSQGFARHAFLVILLIEH